MRPLYAARRPGSKLFCGRSDGGRLRPPPQPVDQEVNHRRRVQRQYLRHEQAADDGDAERPAQFGAGARGDHQRDAREQRRHRRHQDGPEPRAAGLEDGVRRRQAAVALGIEREVHDHDANNEVRQAVAAVLGKIGDPSAVPALCEALHDADNMVRYTVVEQLGEIGDPSTVPAMGI